MKYISIFVALGFFSSVIGLTLAQAAITLPQKIKILSATSQQKLPRVRQTRVLSPLPTMASQKLNQVNIVQSNLAPTRVAAPIPTLLPTNTPAPLPSPTNKPDPTKTPPTPTPKNEPLPTSASIRIIPTSSGVSQQSLQDATNAYRASAGKSALSLRDDLCALADTRAREIRDSFDHSGFRSRVDSGELKALNYKGLAENIWHGTGDASKIVQDWSESSGHNKNLLEEWQWGCGAHSDSYAAYLYLR